MKPLSVLFYFLCFPAFMYSQNEPFLNVTLRVQGHTPLWRLGIPLRIPYNYFLN